LWRLVFGCVEKSMIDNAFRQYANKKGLAALPDTDATTEEEAMWRAMLADMPPEWVARQLSTKVLRDVLVSRGYDVTKPAEKEARDYE
jgi:hypothetical protein